MTWDGDLLCRAGFLSCVSLMKDADTVVERCTAGLGATSGTGTGSGST